MLRDNERVVFYYDAKLHSFYRGIKSIPPLTMRSLLKIAEELYGADGTMKGYRGETQWFYLSDISVGTKWAELLVNVSDQNSAEPVFSNPRTKKRRRVKKEEDEGGDYSAHLLICLDPLQSDPHTYRTFIEQAPTLGPGRINRYFNFLLAEAKKEFPERFEIDHPDGSTDPKTSKPRQIIRRHRMEFVGHASKELIDDIKAGQLLGVTLMTESKRNAGWDEHGYAVEKFKTVEIALRDEKIQRGVWPALKHIFNKADKGGYEAAKIRFKSANNLHRTVMLETARPDRSALDEEFVRKAIIKGFSTALSQSSDSINQEVIARMKALHRDDS